MKIGLIQNNYIIGDIGGNAKKIISSVKTAAGMGADLSVTSELAILGYPPRDLLFNKSLIKECRTVLEHIVKELAGCCPTLIGIVEESQEKRGKPLYNAAALIAKGRVEKIVRKTLLPTYDVFDEERYFEPSAFPELIRIGTLSVGVSVCEDIWNDTNYWSHPLYTQDPISSIASQGVDIIINLSASPFTLGKQIVRESILSSTAKKYSKPVIYVNQVGGNDDLVFDGRSSVYDKHGTLIARAKAFQEDVIVVDLERSAIQITNDDFSPESEAWRALVLGTKDYIHKCRYNKAIVGLSGGIDSSLTAAIAVHAVGKENVLGVVMPSPYTSEISIEDANDIASKLGIQTLQLPINELMTVYNKTLSVAFEGYGKDTTEENIQARIRGNLLMALSNKYRAMVLSTGNKSELSVGYCTLYGDLLGGLAVLGDVPKTLVYRIARWVNTNVKEYISERILTKPPTAELRPNQKDEDDLPTYDVLDRIIALYIEQHASKEEIVKEGFDRKTVEDVLKKIHNAEFKRKQAPVGLKITDRAFGTGWRMPVVSSFRD